MKATDTIDSRKGPSNLGDLGKRMDGLGTSLVGIAGVVVGVLMTEGIRRWNRIESFAQAAFERRLSKYEELLALVNRGYGIATDVMEDDASSAEERLETISAAILQIAEFADENALFIDAEVAGHCIATFMGAEDVPDITDTSEKDTAIAHIQDEYVEAKRLILEDSGMHQVNRLLRKVNKPTHDSPIISYMCHLRENPEERDSGATAKGRPSAE